MKYDKSQAVICFDECKKLLSEYNLPEWDNLPELELYMDQVITSRK